MERSTTDAQGPRVSVVFKQLQIATRDDLHRRHAITQVGIARPFILAGYFVSDVGTGPFDYPKDAPSP